MAGTHVQLLISPTGRPYFQCSDCEVSVAVPLSQRGYTDPEAQVIAYRMTQMLNHMNDHGGTDAQPR